jgi:hypothetical protein
LYSLAFGFVWLQFFVGGFEVIEVTRKYIDALESLASTENILEESFSDLMQEEDSEDLPDLVQSGDDGSDSGEDAPHVAESKRVSRPKLPAGAKYPMNTDQRFLLHRWQSRELGQSLAFVQDSIYVGLSQFLAERGLLGYGVYAARDFLDATDEREKDY